MFSGKKFAPKFLPIMFSLLAIMLAACGGSGGTTATTTTHTTAAQNKQVLVSGAMAGIPDIKTFDPALVTDLYSQLAVDNVFTSLVQLDDHLNIQPQLAASYQVMPNGVTDSVTYKFTLRPNLVFSDGTRLTSADVVYSINRALDPATASPSGPFYLKYIKDASKLGAKGGLTTLIGDSLLDPDPNTVEIITAKPYAFFLDALADPVSRVVERSLIMKYGKSWTNHLTEGGGDGPFKVKEYTHSKQIVFVPNPNYYGPKPKLQEIIFPFIQNAPTAYQDYLANQIDNSYVPSDYFAQDKSRPDFHITPLLAINYYTMNYMKKPFDNIKIRQAFALAIDKDLLANKIWHGQYLATNHIIPQGMSGYDPNLTGPDGVKGTAGDPALAKQLLQQGMQEEGYSSVSQLPPITLTYSSVGDQSSKNEAAAIQQMWQTTLGISVKTDDIDINTIFADESNGAANSLAFYSGPAWGADYPDPQDWTTLQFDRGQSQNSMNYGQNNSADAAAQVANQAAMETADVMPAGAARLAAYEKIEQELVNEVAWLPVEQQIGGGLRKPCVQGVVDNSEEITPPNDWANIYISTDSPCANATVQ